MKTAQNKTTQYKTTGNRPLKNIRGQKHCEKNTGEHIFSVRGLKEVNTRTTPGKWKICVSSPFLNCEKIHPIQQKRVGWVIDSLKDDRNIQDIVIFGSSVTDRCHVGCDVDIFVRLDEDKTVLMEAFPFAYDIWTNFTVDSRMLDEINKNGVIVYERNFTGQGN